MKNKLITLVLRGKAVRRPQWAEVLTTKTDNLSLSPGTYMVGEDPLLPESCPLTSTCVLWHAHMSMHMAPTPKVSKCNKS